MLLPTRAQASDRHSGSGYAQWFGLKQAEIAALSTPSNEAALLLRRDDIAASRRERECCGLLHIFGRGSVPAETSPPEHPLPRTPVSSRALAVALAAGAAPPTTDRAAYVRLLHGQSSVALDNLWQTTSDLSSDEVRDGVTTLYDLAHIRALARVVPLLGRCSPRERAALIHRSGSVQDGHQRAITLATWGPQWSTLTEAERANLHNLLVGDEGFTPRSLVHFYAQPHVLPAQFYGQILRILSAEMRGSFKRDLAFYAAPLLSRFNEVQQHAYLSLVAGLRRSGDVTYIVRNALSNADELPHAIRTRLCIMLRVGQGRVRASAPALPPLRIQPVGPTG